jgi:hypothetical protein
MAIKVSDIGCAIENAEDRAKLSYNVVKGRRQICCYKTDQVVIL